MTERKEKYKQTFLDFGCNFIFSMDFVDLIKTPKLENVILHSQLREPILGSFCLTFSHTIISSRKENSEFELWVSISIRE